MTQKPYKQPTYDLDLEFDLDGTCIPCIVLRFTYLLSYFDLATHLHVDSRYVFETGLEWPVPLPPLFDLDPEFDLVRRRSRGADARQLRKVTSALL